MSNALLFSNLLTFPGYKAYTVVLFKVPVNQKNMSLLLHLVMFDKMLIGLIQTLILILKAPRCYTML